MSKYVYGIDLGATYSCIAYQNEKGEPIVIINSEGSDKTPSVISLAEDEPVVGQVAKENAVFDAAYTLSMVKNKIGCRDEYGNPMVIYCGENADKEISPTTASAYILKKLAADAGRALDDEVKSVVITCPASFNSEQRRQTMQAGIEAGLDVLAIIDEPIAAALCYGCSCDVEGQTFLVYDLGGSAFDATVIRVEDGKFKVVSTEGNHDLGGILWDQVIYDYIEEKYREQTGDEDEFEMDVLQDLTLKSEKAKQNLTGKSSTTVVLSTDNGKAKIEIARETFDDITSSLLEETIMLTKKAIAAAQGFVMDEKTGKERSLNEVDDVFEEKFRPSEIDRILLVGGAAQMPQVEARLKEAFGGLKIVWYEPAWAAAKGAAIYASLVMEDRMLDIISPSDSAWNEHQFPPDPPPKPIEKSDSKPIIEKAILPKKSCEVVVKRYDEENPHRYKCFKLSSETPVEMEMSIDKHGVISYKLAIEGNTVEVTDTVHEEGLI